MEEIRETLGAVLERQASTFPEKDFIVFPDRNLRFTYAAFDARVNALARGLMAIGIGKGDHVGIWATQRSGLAHRALCHREDRHGDRHREHLLPDARAGVHRQAVRHEGAVPDQTGSRTATTWPWSTS